MTVHSKVVILASAGLVIAGTVVFRLIELNNPDTLANLSYADQWLASMFQAVTPRTAGFNTLPLEKLEDSSLFLMVILMIIGASPASTGGGIKTTT